MQAATQPDLRSYVVSQIDDAVNQFVKDIDAMSDENICKTWGGGSRAACDFIYEVGLINKRVATRLRGEDPGPMPWNFGEGWLVAPEEYRSKAALVILIETSGKELRDSVGEDVNRPIQIGEDIKPAYERALFAALHTTYHDAQLNYIQSLAGDMAVHWD